MMAKWHLWRVTELVARPKASALPIQRGSSVVFIFIIGFFIQFYFLNSVKKYPSRCSSLYFEK